MLRRFLPLHLQLCGFATEDDAVDTFAVLHQTVSHQLEIAYVRAGEDKAAIAFEQMVEMLDVLHLHNLELPCILGHYGKFVEHHLAENEVVGKDTPEGFPCRKALPPPEVTVDVFAWFEVEKHVERDNEV